MHRSRLLHPITCSLFAAALLLSGAPLHAQASEGAPFRTGQWGAEFILNGNALGILRFSSPTSAWIGQVQGSFQSTETDEDSPPSSPSFPSSTFARTFNYRAIEVQFGKRWYRPLVGDVLQHFTFGALASNNRQEHQLNNNIDRVEGTNSVGLFADFGAQWMVTKNLSLGARYGLGARIARSSVEDANTEFTITNTLLTIGPVGIRAALYF